MRLDFDMTVDDAVDLNHRALRRSEAVRSMRSRSIWIPTVVSGPLVLVTWSLSSGALPGTPGEWAFGIGIAGVVSVLAYLFGRWYYDSTVSRRMKRIVLEHFKQAKSVRCAIELRSTDVWTSQDGTEISFPLHDIDEVVDTDDAIEVRFRNGLVVARNQVFSSPNQRGEFLALIRAGRSRSSAVTSTRPAVS
jgi:hypothetical protein